MKAICTSVEFASGSDAAEIAALSRKYVEYDMDWRYRPSRIRDSIRSKSKNVVVARARGGIAGFGIMTYLRDSANLDLLAVKTGYRRRGVGSRIVAWLEAVARTAGIASVFVQVRKRNRGALRFYQQRDFRVVDEAAGYYQGRETAVILCKKIGEPFVQGRGPNAEFDYRKFSRGANGNAAR